MNNHKSKSDKDDKILVGPGTTGSFGISASPNITSDLTGTTLEDDHSFFPHFHEYESWSSKTDTIMNLELDTDNKE